MKKMLNFIGHLLLFLIFCTVGISFGGIIAFGFTAGYFSGWKSLDSPYKFERIEEANSTIVWARATNGKIYSWDSNCNRESLCLSWVDANEVPNDVHGMGEMPMEKSVSCGSWYEPPLWKPRDIRECAYGQFAGPEFGYVAYYALLENGEIWASYHGSSMIMVFVVFSFCGIVGFVLGIIAFPLFVRRLKKKNPEAALPSSASTV